MNDDTTTHPTAHEVELEIAKRYESWSWSWLSDAQAEYDACNTSYSAAVLDAAQMQYDAARVVTTTTRLLDAAAYSNA